MNSKYQKKENDNKKNFEKNKSLKNNTTEFDLDENAENIKLSEKISDQDINKENLKNSQQINKSPEETNKDSDKSIDYEEEISQLREEKLRFLAEMENLRKRFEKEKIDSIRFGSTNLARDILPPNDNLTRALENIPDNKNLSEPVKNFIDGLKMIQKEFISVLERHGVKKIDALNKKFDHNLHQAMLEIETNKEEKGVVVQEIQSGYTMHDRLLRPAMVGVSKKPKKNK